MKWQIEGKRRRRRRRRRRRSGFTYSILCMTRR
jgi:hypothetical protein